MNLFLSQQFCAKYKLGHSPLFRSFALVALANFLVSNSIRTNGIMCLYSFTVMPVIQLIPYSYPIVLQVQIGLQVCGKGPIERIPALPFQRNMTLTSNKKVKLFHQTKSLILIAERTFGIIIVIIIIMKITARVIQVLAEQIRLSGRSTLFSSCEL